VRKALFLLLFVPGCVILPADQVEQRPPPPPPPPTATSVVCTAPPGYVIVDEDELERVGHEFNLMKKTLSACIKGRST
jgi:hypothetical protein